MVASTCEAKKKKKTDACRSHFGSSPAASPRVLCGLPMASGAASEPARAGGPGEGAGGGEGKAASRSAARRRRRAVARHLQVEGKAHRIRSLLDRIAELEERLRGYEITAAARVFIEVPLLLAGRVMAMVRCLSAQILVMRAAGRTFHGLGQAISSGAVLGPMRAVVDRLRRDANSAKHV